MQKEADQVCFAVTRATSTWLERAFDITEKVLPMSDVTERVLSMSQQADVTTPGAVRRRPQSCTRSRSTPVKLGKAQNASPLEARKMRVLKPVLS